MRKKHLLLSIFIIFLNSMIYGQKSSTDANIFGDVQCEGKHVPFINVSIDGTTVGTMTDATGHFQLINLPVGEFTLRASGIGYKSSTQTVITSANNTVEIKFELEKDVQNIEQVVVSADRNQLNRSEAPVIVTTIPPKVLALTQSINIAEGLCYSPGLRTECNCQNCGFSQLRINGLDGPYSQILINSRPIFSNLAGVYGLELIPANMVERLEVVRGGGSALFGGNAIAGTVNVITKEPQNNSFNIDVLNSFTKTNPLIKSQDIAHDLQLNANASIVSENRKQGGYIYAMRRDKSPLDEDGDGFSESVLLKNSTFGINTYYKPGFRSKINIDAYSINEFRRGGNKFEMLPHTTDITEQIRHNIIGACAGFDVFFRKYDRLNIYVAGQKTDREAYYGAEQDPNAYGFTKDFITNAGAQYTLKAERFLFAQSSTVIGLDNTYNKLNDNKNDANGLENTIISNQHINTIGSFIQHDWKTKKINISMGARVDNYTIADFQNESRNIVNTVFLPRANLLFKATHNLQLRANYSKGYRAPQIFSEDLHIELTNAKRVIYRQKDNLTQETSDAITLALTSNFNIKTAFINILLEGFYTKLNNPFDDTYEEDETAPGTFYHIRQNATDGAQVYGVNFELNIQFYKKLELQLGYSQQQSKYNTARAWGTNENDLTDKFMRTPDSYGFATLNYNPFKNFTATLTFNYTGSMYVPHFGLDPDEAGLTDEERNIFLQHINAGNVIQGEKLEKSEGFYIFDLLFAYDFSLSSTSENKMQIYAGVKNIMNQTQNYHDKGVYRDAGYIYGPCKPRTFNIGLKLNINY